jgi:hypothetical protein
VKEKERSQFRISKHPRMRVYVEWLVQSQVGVVELVSQLHPNKKHNFQTQTDYAYGLLQRLSELESGTAIACHDVHSFSCANAQYALYMK